MIRVLVADDQALVRAGLAGIIDTAPDLQTIGVASEGAQAVALARDLHPDVVLMDIRMPGMDGMEATRQITGSRVLVLTTFDLDQYVNAALRAGASGFLLKDTPPREVLDAIRVVDRGDALLSPSITRRPRPCRRPARQTQGTRPYPTGHPRPPRGPDHHLTGTDGPPGSVSSSSRTP